MACILLCRGRDRLLSIPGRMVRSPENTIMESTIVALWPGVDIVVRDDGRRGLAGVEEWRLEGTSVGTRNIQPAMAIQRAVDTVVLWSASDRDCLH